MQMNAEFSIVSVTIVKDNFLQREIILRNVFVSKEVIKFNASAPMSNSPAPAATA